MLDKELEKFVGKNIKMSYYIDSSYRIDGTPQYRRICWINGNKVFDSKERLEKISWNEFSLLQKYAFNIGAYNREINCYGRCDLYYQFRVR